MSLSKQELGSKILKKLQETECLRNIRIIGSIDFEGESLTITYKEAENANLKKFYQIQGALERKVEETANEFFLGLTLKIEGPSEHEEYKITLTRNPEVGIGVDPTLTFLEKFYEKIKNKYTF